MTKAKPELNQENWDIWYSKTYWYFFKRIDDKSSVEELCVNTLEQAFLKTNVTNFAALVWKIAHIQLVQYINFKNTQKTIVAEDLEVFGKTAKNIETDDVWQKWLEPETENQFSDRYNLYLNNLLECLKHNLKESEIEIVKLSIHQEKNSTEIAQILNLKADTVRQKLSRTLKKLRANCLDFWKELQLTNKFTN